ncbi:hypothetical protein [Methanoregula sp.]|uniref:hypothetical protein n=1 Tax=Methanoregula sp. TaxID=2052170 RepID=UPI003C145C26
MTRSEPILFGLLIIGLMYLLPIFGTGLLGQMSIQLLTNACSVGIVSGGGCILFPEIFYLGRIFSIVVIVIGIFWSKEEPPIKHEITPLKIERSEPLIDLQPEFTVYKMKAIKTEITLFSYLRQILQNSVWYCF